MPWGLSRKALAVRLVEITPTIFSLNGKGFVAEPFRPATANNVQAISAAEANHLPIYHRKLRPTPRACRDCQSAGAGGDGRRAGGIVLGIVLDTLSGRSPLYHYLPRRKHSSTPYRYHGAALLIALAPDELPGIYPETVAGWARNVRWNVRPAPVRLQSPVRIQTQL
jgi:hypothetical protein